MTIVLRGLAYAIFVIICVNQSMAQNVGIGTNNPATRLDVAGSNSWDLTNSEGDVRIGNSNYRLKLGVALGGVGAGTVNIMQYGLPGGGNILNLGSQGNHILSLNGNLNRAGIGTDVPNANFEIRSANGFSAPQLLIRQTNVNDFSRFRFTNSTGSNYWDIASYHGATAADDRLNFYNGRNSAQFSLNGNGALIFNNNAGTAGQVLQTNGAGNSPSWTSGTNALYNNTNMVTASSSYDITSSATPTSAIPGLVANFSTSGNAKVHVTVTLEVAAVNCASFCPGSRLDVLLYLDGIWLNSYRHTIPSNFFQTISITRVLNVSAGNHTIDVRGSRFDQDVRVYSANSNISYQVIPQ